MKMFLIRDKGVKALEKNLEKAREQIKKLEKDNKALFLEKETLKYKNMMENAALKAIKRAKDVGVEIK